MKVAGLISGTSHDGIDLAVVDFSYDRGALSGDVIVQTSVAYQPDLRARIIAALPPTPTTIDEVCKLDTLIGQAFADVAEFGAKAADGVDAVCSHGQTVFHWVEGQRALGTLQLGQAAWIAERIGVPTVSDVRARDLTVGGHGAPLASFIDELVLRDRPGVAAALNLGGISNITVVDDSVSAFDIGTANALVDAVVARAGLNPLGYDDDGQIARSGTVDDQLLAILLDDPYYRLEPPKSTGKELFHYDYVAQHVARLDHDIAPADLVATLTELAIVTIADAVSRAGITYLVVSGGGVRNPVLRDGIARRLPEVEVVNSDAVGLPTDTKEAILMALIGWCTMHGVPAIIPSATGAREARVLGAITPGAGPLVMPEAVSGLDSLRLTIDGQAR